MSKQSVNRRDFIKLMGIGATSLGIGIASSKSIAKTPDGLLVESTSEYGGFLVEKIRGKKFPYECDPYTIKRMSEKSTTFSRNIRDPARRKRPETKEDLTYINLGEIPNQACLSVE